MFDVSVYRSLCVCLSLCVCVNVCVFVFALPLCPCVRVCMYACVCALHYAVYCFVCLVCLLRLFRFSLRIFRILIAILIFFGMFQFLQPCFFRVTLDTTESLSSPRHLLPSFALARSLCIPLSALCTLHKIAFCLKLSRIWQLTVGRLLSIKVMSINMTFALGPGSRAALILFDYLFYFSFSSLHTQLFLPTHGHVCNIWNWSPL